MVFTSGAWYHCSSRVFQEQTISKERLYPAEENPQILYQQE